MSGNRDSLHHSRILFRGTPQYKECGARFRFVQECEQAFQLPLKIVGCDWRQLVGKTPVSKLIPILKINREDVHRLGSDSRRCADNSRGGHALREASCSIRP